MFTFQIYTDDKDSVEPNPAFPPQIFNDSHATCATTAPLTIFSDAGAPQNEKSQIVNCKSLVVQLIVRQGKYAISV